jgi:hypothetical protein
MPEFTSQWKGKTMVTKYSILMLVALAALAMMTGCSDDDPTAPVVTTETFTLTIENVSAAADYPVSGVFNTPVGAGGPAPIFPGEAYEFTFGAKPGDMLSFATMFVQSNDLFYAPSGAGIALFNAMTPVNGDVTAQIHLWDAGTEMNEEPGVGANQAPRQGGANLGAADMNTAVRMVADGFTYPMVSDVIAVTITHLGDNLFTVRLENVSDANTLMTSNGSVAVPLAPGVAVVHGQQIQLFASGVADAGLGLEGLAEDGDPSGLATSLDGAVGVTSVTVFNTPTGAGGPAPIFPGEIYELTFTAKPGDCLSLATMFVQSNDLFYAFDPAGLALFDAMGNANLGDVTASIDLWDAGTEMNQWPGVGPDQAPRQAGADTGADDATATVRMVDDGYSYPADMNVIRVTLSKGN